MRFFERLSSFSGYDSTRDGEHRQDSVGLGARCELSFAGKADRKPCRRGGKDGAFGVADGRILAWPGAEACIRSHSPGRRLVRPPPAAQPLCPTSRSAPQPETPPDAPNVSYPFCPPYRHHNREDRPLTKTKPGQPKPNLQGRYPLQLSVDQPLFDALFSTPADFSRANPKTSAKVSRKLSLWFWDGAQHVDSYRRACD